MNLLFLDSERRSKAMLIAQTYALNVKGVIWEMFFKCFPFMYCCISWVFSSLDLSMKMCKYLEYLSLTFSNSSWKITRRVLFCGIYRLLNLCLGSLWFKVEYLVWLSYVFLSNPCLLLQWLFPSRGQFFVFWTKSVIVCRICWAWF